MNYSVKYSIAVGGGVAEKELASFLRKVNSVIPAANKKFDTMSTHTQKLLTNLRKIKAEMQFINKIGVSIKSKPAISELKLIQKKINTLKGKTVSVTVKEKSVGGVAGTAKSKTKSAIGKSVMSSKKGAMGKMFAPTSMMSAGGIPFATTIGAGLIGLGLRNIISQASEFEHTMTSVRAILSASDSDLSSFSRRFDSMSKTMRTLGVETKFTAVEISEATKFLAMAGMDTGTIEKSMKSIANLAMIGDSDLGEMADIMTNIMTGYGITSDYISVAADNMAAVISNANVSTLEMGESMKYASNYMRMAGVEFAEGSAAIGVLGDAGIKGSRAGTSMRAMIIRLIKPTTTAQKVIDRLGLSFTQVVKEGGKSKTILRPLADIFSDIKKSGASMKDITAIFDKIGGGAAMSLVDHIEKLRLLTEMGKTSGGLADFQAAEKMKTVLGLGQQIKSQFLELGQQLFNRISPKLKVMMNELLGWMKSDEAGAFFEKIESGLMGLVNGLRSSVVFMKSNWGWLKYVFGVAVVKGGAMKLAGAGMSAFNGVKSTVNMVGGIGAMSGIGSAGAAATASTGTLMASLSAIVAGGAIAAGLGFIAVKLWELHKAAKNIASINDDVADWSVSKVGLNTESLDIIRAKLDGVYDMQTKIREAKDKPKDQQNWESQVDSFNKLKRWRGKNHTVTDAYSQIQNTVRNMAIGGARGQSIEKTFSQSLASGNLSGGITALGGISKGYHDSPKSYMSMSSLDSDKDGFSAAMGSATALRALEDYSLTMRDTLTKLNGALNSTDASQNLQMLSAMDSLFGNKKDLGGFINDMRSGNYKSPEDIKNRLSVNKLSATGIKMALAETGLNHDMIIKIMAAAGLGDAMSSIVKGSGSTTPVSGAVGEDGEGGALGALGGVGGLSKTSTGRAIVVNIDKLCNVESANFKDEEDLEAYKAKMAAVLIDVVNDFSRSNV